MLRSQGHVVTGCLYDAGGALFTQYHRRGAPAPPCPPAPEAAGSGIEGGLARVWTPVLLDGTPTGSLFLLSDLSPLRDRQRVQLWTLAAVLAVALAGGMLLALRLQRIVTRPLGDLAATAEAVTRRRDYSLRARRRSEDEVGELVDAFNQMLAEIEAADASLREAREESEAANRLKDEFLATLSHELRTPLNAILGWVALLQRAKTDPALLERATEVIERNTRAQAQLVDDLLDMSRIITGKLSLDLRPVDLPTMLASVAETVGPAAEAKGIHLEVEVPEALPPLRADAARLQQVVWNLVSNAVKFSPGEGRVWIRARRRRAQIEIEVEGQGIGIPEEFLPHVFERFSQQDSSTTRAHGGLGLGLAIVRHLVELHGGEVEAESPGAGHGATFRIRLPLRPAAAAGAGAAAADGPVGLDGLHVLLVEDEADTRELYRVVLERSGARVVAVASAGEALERFADGTPDVLVSDIGLRDVDGYELIARIRRLPPGEGGRVPAVAVTAYVGEEHERRALAAGFQVHVAKPVGADELVTLVRRLATEGHAAPSPR